MISLLFIIAAYLVGSVSIGYLFAKRFKRVDIRKLGSGSAGATNISRLMGFKVAVIVLILDVLKGFLTIYAALVLLQHNYLAGEWVVLISSIAVIAGHIWPVYFNFKGGRGAATLLGVFLALMPLPTLIVFVLVCVIIFLTRYVSLGSISGAIAVPIAVLFTDKPPVYFYFGLLISIIIVYQHRENIKRLLTGTEAKIGQRIKTPGSR